MYQKKVLPNGVRIVTEEIPYVRSVAVGIWVGAGSRNETEEISGISHFLEHMLFKGTEKRTAKDIAEALDAVGGQLNAYTTKEYTCYYAKVLDDHFNLAIDVLTDMFFNSRFDPQDIMKEKNVVLEEIKMYEDSPDELIHDLLASTVWPEHPLGRPILGQKQIINSLSREEMINYLNERYTSEQIVVAVAGKVKHQDVVAKFERVFSQARQSQKPAVLTPPAYRTGQVMQEKDTEQIQICLGMPGLPQEHDNIYVMNLLNNILGGGVSSRLFQEIREERGLAYSVYSYHSSYKDTGLFTVYAGTSPGNFPKVMELILQELAKLKEKGVTEQELKRTQEQIKGNLYLGLESVSSRMSRLGRTELCFNRLITPDEVIERVYQVTRADILRLAEQIIKADEITLTTIGPTISDYSLEKSLSLVGI